MDIKKLVEQAMELKENIDGTGVYHSFTFDNVDYNYQLNSEELINGVRYVFDVYYSISIDGKDNDIWNMCAELNLFDKLTDSPIFDRYCEEKLKDNALEAYKEDKEDID